jgi:hypothetical protein
MGVMNWKRPTAIKGTMNHAKTSFSTEIFAGAMFIVVHHLAPPRYSYTWSSDPALPDKSIGSYATLQYTTCMLVPF